MIIDDVTVDIWAGDGGNGAVSFRREKFVPRGGPDGGNGGDGGNVFLEAINDITALKYFRNRKHIKADRGGHGQGQKKHGKKADDLTIKIPAGTTVEDVNSDRVWEFNEVGDRKRIARGGRGGRGNFEFRSNENKAPKEAEDGEQGQRIRVRFNLKFIADVGLIGLPSAGKSSLLNALTKAESRVGAYPFTTLEPHLGMLGTLILADIPGLIGGAHTGKGLGDRFLKHVEKTKIFLHCIDATSDNVDDDYNTIRGELEAYNKDLLDKREIILLTKSDLVDEKIITEKSKKLSKYGDVYPVSIINDDQLEKLQTLLTSL